MEAKGTEDEFAGLKKTVYYGFAILAVLVIASTAYLFTQVNSLNNKLYNEELSANAVIANRLAGIESRLQLLESVNPFKRAVVQFVYDSDCSFCKNDELLELLPQLTQQFAKSNVLLQTIDVKTNESIVGTLGLTRVPIFFASRQALNDNVEVGSFLSRVTNAGFELTDVGYGIVAFVPNSGELVAIKSCAEPGLVKLKEFYADSCIPCQQVQTEVGALQKRFGGLMDYTQHCVAVFEGDEVYCEKLRGEMNASLDTALALTYGVSLAYLPAFMIDCKYAFSANDATLMEEAICAARPDVCGELPELVPTNTTETLNITETNQTNSSQ